jgi:hypothetical protein
VTGQGPVGIKTLGLFDDKNTRDIGCFHCFHGSGRNLPGQPAKTLGAGNFFQGGLFINIEEGGYFIRRLPWIVNFRRVGKNGTGQQTCRELGAVAIVDDAPLRLHEQNFRMLLFGQCLQVLGRKNLQLERP